MNTKKQLFADLVKNEFPQSLNEIWEQPDIFGWPSDHGYDVSLAPVDIVTILQRYLAGNLSEQQVEDWANFIEAVSYEVGGVGDDTIMDAIHGLANPVLEGPLTRKSAENLILRLQENG